MSDSASTYALGRSEREYQRLMLQSRVVRPWTEHYLRAAGLRPGATVLDLGSGVGDVSLLAAQIVGPGGRVLGIDHDAQAVELARERVASEGLSDTVRFEVAGLADFGTSQRFDAVIGRYVLVFQPDPSATLRRSARLLRPGGILVFHEMDMAIHDISWPPCAVYDECLKVAVRAFIATGAHPDMGRSMTRLFFEAGLVQPTVEVITPMATGPDSPILDWMARTLQSEEPVIASEGLSLPPGVDFNGLLLTWQEAIVAAHAQFRGPIQYGAWTRV